MGVIVQHYDIRLRVRDGIQNVEGRDCNVTGSYFRGVRRSWKFGVIISHFNRVGKNEVVLVRHFNNVKRSGDMV